MDVFRAIYNRYSAFQGTLDAYTLTSGRLYQNFAPPSLTLPGGFPYIVVVGLGGERLQMFTGSVIRQGHFQFSVFDEWRGDATRAWNIYRSLSRIFKRPVLGYTDDEIAVDCMQITEPRADIGEGVIHVSADWRIERQQ